MKNRSVEDATPSLCVHENAVYDLANGEVVCEGCGLILDQQITDSEAFSFSHKVSHKPIAKRKMKR